MNIISEKSFINLTSEKIFFIETEQTVNDIDCVNLIIGEIQCEELLLDEQLVLSKNFDERFAYIELCCGLENTRLVAQLLCSCSYYGITKLELLDAFRLHKCFLNMSWCLDDLMCANALIVLKQFGNLQKKIIIIKIYIL